MSGNFDGFKFGSFDQDSRGRSREGEEFNDLLEKNQKSTLESKLQPARVGGYTKRSVEDLILEMQLNLAQVKSQLESQLVDLAAEKANVINECSVVRSQLKAAVETLAMRNQPSVYSGDKEDMVSAQEAKQYREENERLTSMLLDIQSNSGDKKKYEELLKQKEVEIGQMREALDKYSDECNALKEKIEQLEIVVSNSSAAEKEVLELRQQKEEIENRYQELLQNIEKTNLEFQERKRSLDEKEAQLEDRQRYLDELQDQLEQEKAYLTEEKTRMEEKKQLMDDIQQQLETEKERQAETQAQLDIKSQQLSEIQANLESDMRAKEFVGQVMTKDFENAENWTAEDLQGENAGDRLFESLYMHFSHLRNKVEHQQTEIAEKEALKEQMKVLESETAILRQENESAKATIDSLKNSFDQLMEEMDEQTETLNKYISRSRKDRELLKSSLAEGGTSLAQKPPAQQSPQDAQIAELEEENEKLEDAVLRPYSQILRIENAKKILPLSDNTRETDSGEQDAANYDAMRMMNKAADI